MVDAVYSVSSFPDPEGLGEVILFGVGHGFRVIDLLAFVALGMAGAGVGRGSGPLCNQPGGRRVFLFWRPVRLP